MTPIEFAKLENMWESIYRLKDTHRQAILTTPEGSSVQEIKAILDKI